MPLPRRLAWRPSGRGSRSAFARWASGAFALLGLAWAGPAAAQLTGSQGVELQRTGVSVSREVARSDAQFPFYINRQDCLEDAKLVFRPRVQGATARTPLQVWVSSGVDCTNISERSGGTARCSQVAELRAPTSNQALVIEVSSQDVAHAANTRQQLDVQGAGTKEDCDSGVEQNLSFYFMLVDADGQILGTVAKWQDSQIDLIGPPPPDEVTTGIGDNKLIVDWDIAEADERKDTVSFALYCDIASEGSGEGSGEAAGTAGAAGASSVSDDPTCGPGRLAPGTFPERRFRCGTAEGVSTRTGRAKPLENGRRYAVAVAAVDEVGNPGLLSKVACGTPEPVTTFFEAYRAAGGEGGGGYCAIGAAPASGALYAVLGAGALWLVRRRRPRA